MRILTVAEGYPPEPGGGSIYAYEVPKRLGKYGVKTLIVTGSAGRKYKDEKNEAVSVKRLNVPKYNKAGFSFNTNRFKFIFEAIKTCSALRDEYDVFHFHSGMSSKMVAWVLRNIYRIKKPFVMTFLGTFIGSYKKLHPFPISNIFDFSSKRLIKDARFDSFIVVDDGTHAYELLKKEKVKSRINKHYQCVDCDKFKPMKKSREVKTIGYIGRLDPMKGVDLFIKALPKVLRTHKSLKVLIVGDGPLMQDLKHMVKKLGIEKNVKFVGPVSHSKMPRYMNLFDCLIFNDIRSFDNRDLISLTHCEAMACGALMLNSAKPRKEWRRKTWIEIVKPDPNEISSNLLDVLDNPGKYRQLAKNARKVALKYFDWDKVVKMYYEEFCSLIRGSNK